MDRIALLGEAVGDKAHFNRRAAQAVKKKMPILPPLILKLESDHEVVVV